MCARVQGAAGRGEGIVRAEGHSGACAAIECGSGVKGVCGDREDGMCQASRQAAAAAEGQEEGGVAVW